MGYAQGPGRAGPVQRKMPEHPVGLSDYLLIAPRPRYTPTDVCVGSLGLLVSTCWDASFLDFLQERVQVLFPFCGHRRLRRFACWM